jgi:flagellar basal-body rod modification protein FlgD
MDAVTGSGALDALRWQQEDYKKADKDDGQLTQADFFALMTTQLAYQDPTKPVENSEMISQMTGFSTNSGIGTLNEQFTSFSSSMTSSQALQASSLVGRNVLVNDNSFTHSEGGYTQAKLMTDQPASNVMIRVENAAGEAIQTVPLGRVDGGEFAFHWDGTDANGNQAPSGAYKFKVTGLIDGDTSELQTMTYRKVDSVTLAGAGGNISLNLNDGNSMALSDIVEVAGG